MILGLGTDVVECGRIREALAGHDGRFESRVFTEEERRYCHRMKDPTPHFAARFAAKEAARKAMAYGPDLNWRDVEVVRDPEGPVQLRFHGTAAEVAAQMWLQRAFLSVSHERSVAVATVILEG